MTTIERIGHRGSPRRFVENTLPSFLAAFDEGADAVELDVHVTVDGVAVVHHDPAFGSQVKPADYRGRAISTLLADQLTEVELDTHQLRLPTLAEVMHAVASRGMVYVEIKGGSESVVAAALSGYSTRCAVHSFDHAAVARMRDIAPAIPRGILFDRYPTDVEASMRATGARDVWPAWRLIDDRLVDAVHRAGGRIIPWTVNSPQNGVELAALGVDGICTDDVPEAFRLLESRH